MSRIIRIAICDDEPIFYEDIMDRIVKLSVVHDFEYELLYFSTGAALIGASDSYDILFLDIRLENGSDGISLGKQLRARGNRAVFILATSLLDRHREGYQAGVHRYLEKPFQDAEFSEALVSAIRRRLLDRPRIEIEFYRHKYSVYLDEILYFNSLRRKRCIITKTECFETMETLDSIHGRLPANQFFQPHKSYLINLAHVKHSTKTKITMADDVLITLSRGKYDDFNTQFMKFIGGHVG